MIQHLTWFKKRVLVNRGSDRIRATGSHWCRSIQFSRQL